MCALRVNYSATSYVSIVYLRNQQATCFYFEQIYKIYLNKYIKYLNSLSSIPRGDTDYYGADIDKRTCISAPNSRSSRAHAKKNLINKSYSQHQTAHKIEKIFSYYLAKHPLKRGLYERCLSKILRFLKKSIKENTCFFKIGSKQGAKMPEKIWYIEG